MASEDADENVNGGSGTPDGTSPAQGAQRSDADASADQPLDPKTAAAVAAAEAAGAANGETVRIDSWIWAVRLIKTRSLGAAACRGGHVHVNGERVKAAYSVRIGDEVRLRNEGRERIVIVKRLIRKRVGAPVAAQCYVDNSPPPPPREAIAPAGLRDRGAGRPTKRDRREMERLRGLAGPPGPSGSPDFGGVTGPGGHGGPGGPGGSGSSRGSGGRGSGRGTPRGSGGPGGSHGSGGRSR
ncbi:RNA-binding S4 domain-containing protein [Streptomyces sp. 1222.5]|uniref:RNA-binding S4 domain-containing protein n=1 Tax=Streptomyces sp. 1222.5 TaxID=1881026 RepID=UPI003D716237